MIGKTLSHFRIEAKLGAGGMGEVYRATDTKLDRDVALKVLPAHTLADEAARKRFHKEALALSKLNHPNIATVYEFDTQGGVDFLVMEYVEGTTLSEKVSTGPLSEEEVTKLGAQVASALEEAHEQGVIHRDLKPSNVMVTPKGQSKVLDFGLAKLVQPVSETAVTESLTDMPGVAGTLPYMAPEQLQGQPVDGRTDLHALGALLYQMVTGQRPFPEAQTPQLIAAILHRTPRAPSELNSQVSVGLESIILKAMQKDPEVRYQNASAILADLKRLRRETESGVATASRWSVPAPRPKLRWRKMALPIVAAGLILAGTLAYQAMAPLPRPVITKYTQLTNDGREKFGPLFTDGPRVYFRARVFAGETFRMYQVPAAGGEATEIPMPIRDPRPAAISPDKSNFLVFGGEIKGREARAWVVPIAGGTPRRLGDLWGHDGTWTPDGQQIIYANGNDLYVANSDGTDSRKLVSLIGRTLRIRFSPDGGRLRFDVYNQEQVGTFSPWEVSADGTNLHRLLPDWNGGFGHWSADGKYFFLVDNDRDGNGPGLWALREKGGLFGKGRGELIQLSEGPMILSHPHPSTDGKKLFVAGVQPRVELTRFDLRSKQFVPFLEGISPRWPDFTRDGEWVTYTDYPKETLWRMKLDGSQRLQLTQPPMLTMHPRWSPDGKQIAFMGLVSGKPWKIYLISADGGTLQQLTTEERTEGDPTWSPDGNSLVFGLIPTPENPILPLYLYDLTTRQASPLPGSEGLWKPRWSPDGRYIAAAYGSDDKLALYDFTTRKLEQVADVPRARPVWSRDGKYVYFRKVYGENQAIYRLRISDRKIELLTSLEGFREFSRFNVTFSLAPDDSILLVRNVSINEIYALDWEER